jgi:hypothetical protein
MRMRLDLEVRRPLKKGQHLLTNLWKFHTSLVVRSALGELIEDMEIAFTLNLAHHAIFFQKVICNLCTHRLPLFVEHDLQIFALLRNEIGDKFKDESKNIHVDSNCYSVESLRNQNFPITGWSPVPCPLFLGYCYLAHRILLRCIA